MTNSNPVYIKFTGLEVNSPQKSMLSLQMELIRIIKIMKTHQMLRTKEFDLKTKLQKKIKSISLDIKNINTDMPVLESSIEKKANVIEVHASHNKKEKKKEYYDSQLESQLNEIKRQLASLDR